MNTIIKIALAATLAIFAQNVTAQQQTTEQETNVESQKLKNKQLELLNQKKANVEKFEKEKLKSYVKNVNNWVDSGDKTKEEGEELKKIEAQKIARNIEDQLAILDRQIDLVNRNGSLSSGEITQLSIGFGGEDAEGNRSLDITVNEGVPSAMRYDKRTYGEVVLAFGLNNAITENGGDFGDEFSIGRSRFFELGYAWKTRVFKNSGALQFKYGVSLQTNKLFVKDNQTLVVDEGTPTFEEFPFNLDKSQLRFSNLVAPVHFEFGGWKKEQKDDYVRYRLSGQFRMGIGGYVGVRLGTQQKLKYDLDGNRIKTKERRDFEGDNLVYGLSSYIRLADDLSLYGKYELSTAFESRQLGEANNVSLGLRWDW